MSAQPARAYLGISEVLAQLRTDFPDISVSKIRFLETEGLLTPARSPSGYRRFSAADVDRLRYILAAQRDQYLPLRVIKERLARPEVRWPPLAGAVPPPASTGQLPAGHGLASSGPVSASTVSASTVPAGSGWLASGSGKAGAHEQGAGTGQLLTRRELVEAAGISDALLTELEAFGLLRRIGRQYGPEALVVARTAAALTAYGVEARHLRAVRAAAERESTMIESLVSPIQRQRGAGARELAARTAAELASLVMRLHGALVEGALAEAGLAEAGLADSGLAGTGLADEPRAEPKGASA
ncbi:MAG TPA: MerR family transcriptional regulator [Streptosporangiaceae bacterium]|nr:MerR family transcriptional regulator [Streptosporangiaceae bacterium]